MMSLDPADLTSDTVSLSCIFLGHDYDFLGMFNWIALVMMMMIFKKLRLMFLPYPHVLRRASLKSSWSLWIVYLKAHTKPSIPLWVTQRPAFSTRTEVPTKTSNLRSSLIIKWKMSFSLILCLVIDEIPVLSLHDENCDQKVLYMLTWIEGLNSALIAVTALLCTSCFSTCCVIWLW